MSKLGRYIGRPGVSVVLWLGAVGLAACDLGHPDVVSRSPDLGPAVPATDASMRDEGAPANDAPASTSIDVGRDGNGSAPEVKPEVSADSAGRDGRADASPTTADARDADGAEEQSVLRDDFEDGIDGWMSIGITWGTSDDRGSSGTNAVATPTATGATTTYYAEGAWQDMTVEVRVRVSAFGPPSSLNRAEIFARYQEPGQWYGLGLRADRTLALRRNASTWGNAVPVGVSEGEWHTLKLRVRGPRERVTVDGYLDGMLLATDIDTDASLASAIGTVGLGVYGDTIAEFDDVTVATP